MKEGKYKNQLIQGANFISKKFQMVFCSKAESHHRGIPGNSSGFTYTKKVAPQWTLTKLKLNKVSNVFSLFFT